MAWENFTLNLSLYIHLDAARLWCTETDCLLLQGAPAAKKGKGKGAKAAAAEVPETDAAKLEVALAELEAIGAKNLVLEQQRGLAILERVRDAAETTLQYMMSCSHIAAPCT